MFYRKALKTVGWGQYDFGKILDLDSLIVEISSIFSLL